MALKILNPGLRPLGMFDLDDTESGSLNGGEYVELKQEAAVGSEGYAADVGQLGDASGVVNFTATNKTQVVLTPGSTVLALGGLADEGIDEYGTLFGSLIGQNTGKATQFGTLNGAVVIGPSTDRASGKVTVWHAPGLYGVNDQDATLDSASANDSVFGTNLTGFLPTSAGALNVNGSPCAVYVGAMSDSSLVSTTSTAAGEATTTEYHAIYLIGVGA